MNNKLSQFILSNIFDLKGLSIKRFRSFRYGITLILKVILQDLIKGLIDFKLH